MEHLLGRDGQDHRPPPLDRLQLGLSQARPHLRAQAERREQVLGHEAVLELGRLAEQVRQLLAVLDDDPSVARHGQEL